MRPETPYSKIIDPQWYVPANAHSLRAPAPRFRFFTLPFPSPHSRPFCRYCDPPNTVGPAGNCGMLGEPDPQLTWSK